MNPPAQISMSPVAPPACRRIPARILQGMLLVLMATAMPAHAAAWTEPPLVVYGKVVNLSGSSPHQLLQGILRFTLGITGEAPQTLELSTDLHPVGAAGEYSYRVTIPQFIQPTARERSVGFSVGAKETGFTLQATYAESDSSAARRPVTVLDRSQLEALTVSQKNRGSDFRVDLAVSVPETDSDNDGLPDWWEDVHGLKKFSVTDAVLDPDRDGLTNLQEHRLGTDPTTPNHDPLLLEDRLTVPVGGRAGVALWIVDQNSTPGQLFLSLKGTLPGLIWRRLGRPVPIGDEFSYRSVLDGEVTLEAAPDFVSGLTRLSVRDSGGSSGRVFEFGLRVNALSPSSILVGKPVLWLDPRVLATGSVSAAEWADLSGSARDGYQPAAAFQPLVRDGRARFEGGRFLYFDDRGLRAPQFTAFLAFDLDGTGGPTQTLLRSAELQLDVRSIGGRSHIEARQSGRVTLAPLAANGVAPLFTMTAGTERSQLEAPDQGVWLSTSNSTTLPFAFPTVGATRLLTAGATTNHLQGGIWEILLYGSTLSAASRALVQDYQLARWEGFLVWNHHQAVFPARIVGRNDTRNSISGGRGDDRLVGGVLGDILRGGPGDNTLTGGPGSDRFVFARDGSHDTITDFKADEGDVVDLAEILESTSGGTPPQVTVTPIVTRGAGNSPRVDTVIEIRFGGAGAVVDQTITLQEVGVLPASALRLPSEAPLSASPKFVTVEPAGSVRADSSLTARVPNLVDGSLAVDEEGRPVGIFQNPAAGTLAGLGSTEITLTARDAAWNMSTVTTTFLVLAVGDSQVMAWSRSDQGGFRLTVPPGFVLESAAELSGPWMPLPASGEVMISPIATEAGRYFRLRSN